MNKYQIKKEEIRQKAIETQRYMSENSLSYGELAVIQDMLYYYGKRYGLLKEFREEGLL